MKLYFDFVQYRADFMVVTVHTGINILHRCHNLIFIQIGNFISRTSWYTKMYKFSTIRSMISVGGIWKASFCIVLSFLCTYFASNRVQSCFIWFSRRQMIDADLKPSFITKLSQYTATFYVPPTPPATYRLLRAFLPVKVPEKGAAGHQE